VIRSSQFEKDSSMHDYLVRLFHYRGWANQQTLASVQNCPAAQAEAVPLLAHLLAAEHVWLSRLQPREPRFAVWPELSLSECEALAKELDQGWTEYLGGLAEDALQTEIQYRTTRGDPFSNSVVDILTQVATHGGYHRGQIAKAIGRAGGQVIMTDYIVYVRLAGATDR
jgi:uncharacterized damage-inducible protein DinB